MTTIKDFIKRHAVLSYFILTFVLSWGGVLVVIGSGGIPGTSEETKRLFPIALVAMLSGPSIAGVLLTGLVYGRAGIRELRSRMLKWRVGARWYAVALLTIPLLAMPMLFTLSLTSSLFLPGIVTAENKVSLLLSAFAIGLAAGLFEELGWTGFAVPRLRMQYGILTTGLIVGLLWGAWHFLVTFWASGDSSGALSLDLLLPPLLFYIGVLPAYRVLMVWLYGCTDSLLVTMLMHASLTANTLFILMPVVTGMPLMTYYLLLTVALWIAITVFTMRQPKDKLGRRNDSGVISTNAATLGNSR